MSIETEIASLTTAIRNLTDVLLASAAKSLPAAPAPSVTEFPSNMGAFADYVAPLVAAVATAAPTATVTVGSVTTDPTVDNPPPCSHTLTVADLPPHTCSLGAPDPEPKETVKKVPEAPKVSEDDQRVQIVELARPNMADAAFKAFLGGKLAELQGAPCSISGTGKLPKIDAKHLPTLLAAINKQLGK